MSTTRCIYCGRYFCKLPGRECKERKVELARIKEQCEAHKKVLPIRIFEGIVNK